MDTGTAQTQTRPNDVAFARGEKMFRALAENTRVMLVLLDAHGAIRYASPGSRRLLGYDVNEIIGLRALDFVHADDRASMFEQLAALREPNAHTALDVRLVHVNGQMRIARGSAENHLADPDIGAIVVLLEDVTEERLAASALRRSEGQLRSVLDSLPLCVGLLDTAGRLLFGNRTALDLVGARLDDVVNVPFENTPWWESETERALVRDAIARVRRGEHARFEARLHDTTGATRDFDVMLSPMLDEKGKVRSLLASGIDITERVRATKDLLVSQQQLQQAQKMEAIGRLAGGVAHDFNNLLTAILAFSDMVLQDIPADAAARADLLEIHLAAERGSALTRQLLAFSRKNPGVARAIDVAAQIQEMSAMLRRLLPENVELRIKVPCERWKVFVDPGQIEQAVMNLVLNARDAIRGQGCIDVQISNAADAAIGTEAHDSILLTVRDTGCGMDEETLSHLFEPFFTTKAAGHGTGLGLSVVYGMVKQAGAAIAVASTVGEGSEFTITIPRFVGDEPRIAAPIAEPRTLDGRELVLLIEDEETLRAVARRVLERRGYTVMEATDGAAALRVMNARGREIDLVVSDLVMPNMGGRDFIERMRSEGFDPAVLLMSGYSEEALSRAGTLPVNAVFLDKPFTARSLASAVRRAIDAHTAARPA